MTPEPPVEVAPVEAPAQADPVVELLARADAHFESGRREMDLGHLDQAKTEFNRALAVLLESPDGARAPRVREHFDRLVDRISAIELAALATGDGFTETESEPASIDSLLALSTFEAEAPTAATAEAVHQNLQSAPPDIPIPENTRVLRYVEAFQGRLRAFLADGLTRGASYLPMIQQVFRAEGLPLDLAYVPLIESAFKPTALSRASARGVWQFMRATGIENGLKHDWYIDERSDPYKATLAAAKYLKTLHRMFDGDWHLALASYNGGPGRVQRALRRSRTSDFWGLTRTTSYLPRETREYVPMILAAVIIARNPAQYGFDVPPPTSLATERVTVPAAVDLRRVAEWAEVPVDDIQRLNPELRRWTTPIRGGFYDLNVPAGSGSKVQAKVSGSDPATLNALQWHTVRRGESIATIARKLRVSRTDLAEANYLRTNSRVQPGQKLVVPRMPSAALLARAAGATGAAANVVAAAAFETPADEPERIVHRVRSGDTLYSLARKYGTTVSELKTWNRLRSSRLKIGDRLVVHTTRAANAQQ